SSSEAVHKEVAKCANGSCDVVSADQHEIGYRRTALNDVGITRLPQPRLPHYVVSAYWRHHDPSSGCHSSTLEYFICRVVMCTPVRESECKGDKRGIRVSPDYCLTR